MTSKNDVTGDKIQSKIPSKEYKEGWDRIYGTIKLNDRAEEETLLEYYNRKTSEIDKKYRNED